MFGKLKEKLKSWFKKSEEKAEEIVETEEEKQKKIEETIKELEKKAPELKIENKGSLEVEKVEEKIEELKKEIRGEINKKEKLKKEKQLEEQIKRLDEEKEKKKGFFSQLKSKFKFKITEEYFDEIFSDLGLVLLENNVALQVMEKIKSDLKKELIGLEIKKEEVEEKIREALKISLETILSIPQIDLIKIIEKCKEEKRPCILLFLGFNGTGKSLTLTKVALYLKKKSYKPIIAAGDTWRAAGIAQLEKYAQSIKVPIIKHQDGADSCAVIFDTIKAAKAHDYDVVLADTAGRAHTDTNLMQELKKICRVNKPDLKILVVESLIGNDVVNQSKMFDEAVDVNAIIFTKTDVDEKGGAILSASYITKKPILFFGTGQNPIDLEVFKPKKVIDSLEL